jgi:hypothetical protein
VQVDRFDDGRHVVHASVGGEPQEGGNPYLPRRALTCQWPPCDSTRPADRAGVFNIDRQSASHIVRSIEGGTE